MLEYRIARPEEEENILDLINLVFSQTRVPHHFDQLLSKEYAYPGYAPHHYVAVNDGKIRACIAMPDTTLHLNDRLSLNIGLVGSVAVHEKSRGEGHMKKLMDMMIEDGKKRGLDLLILGGQRQRYAYWNFEMGGLNREFNVTYNNVRHALKDVDDSQVTIRKITDASDPALDAAYELMLQQEMICDRDRSRLLSIMQSWNQSFFCISFNGDFLGYLYGNEDAVLELVLADDEKLPQVIKAYMQGKEKCKFVAFWHQKALYAFLKPLAEGCSLSDGKKFRILNWKKVLETCLAYKHQKYPLPAGRMVVEIEGEGRYALSLQGGMARAEETCDAPDFVFTPCQAVSFFFSPLTAMEDLPPLAKSWLPLPLYIFRADSF
ncbi:MAG: GNAT family N-acetyltransferase [Clostridiales bacterium]|nr:GNAT family N-acetyltransferase [Clostridiales bacterium]